ncbi:uncharacterized protein LOC133897116 isoform X3 [Phragmites australis]|uniref:uncharacterized protein LOC133897116 isoform X3 n=1 Tax=Phragmites australis TaxID=29695 RepID=UPI002D76A013|nr:uncharacterized protein LOC133897116 isoform X3 [Phragmites australis]
MPDFDSAPPVAMEEEEEEATAERESTAAAASASEVTLKCKKKNKEAKAKGRGMAEQEPTSAVVSASEGTPKRKKKKVKKKKQQEQQECLPGSDSVAVAEEVKGRGMEEQEATSAASSAFGGTRKRKKKKKEEAKVKDRGISEQEATTGAVSASGGTPKCKKKEVKVEERGMAEQEATTAAVSEGSSKWKEEVKAKKKGMVEQDVTTAAVSASSGTPKCKKMKKKKKMQEQLESPRALSVVVAVDKIVVNKSGNGCADGEGASSDADVSMDPVNGEDPSCAQSKAKDADDLVESKDGKIGIKNCSKNRGSFQESSVGRKRPKKKRKRGSSNRGPVFSSQNGDRVAKHGLDSSTDHDLSCICALCLVQAHKEKVRNIYSARGSLIRFQRKKLLILDLNGLLADINQDYHNAHMAHAKVKAKLVFKRPYCDDFLRFCFQNFELGIWSSRKRENVDSVVNILMRDLKQYLLFYWDMSSCTVTGCNTIDNKHKPLVLKELKKLWNKEDPNLPWEQGEFSPSNTLLVDDSPYKALCNPPHTAIFPYPYSYLNQRDDYSLGPGGDLRIYLERLAAADDVQVFVRDNPFGQPSIKESDPNWNFYVQIIDKVEKSLS